MTAIRQALALLTLLGACVAPAKPVDLASAPGPLIKGVSYVGITVSDLDKTTAYYEAAAGMTEVARGKIAGVRALDVLGAGKPVSMETRLLRGGTGQIRLMQFKATPADASATAMIPVQGPGITHICHQSPDDRPIFPKFVAAGGKPVSRTGGLVQLNPSVPIRYAYVRDRDGVMMETEQVMSTGLPWTYRMRHVAIVAVNMDRTINFYSTLLGGAPRERRSNLVNKTLDLVSNLDDVKLNVAWYKINNLELEVWEYVNPAPTPRTRPRPLQALGYNMIVLDVADVDAASRRLTEAGGVMVTRPAPLDGGRIAFGRDPDGNLIGLFNVNSNSPFSTSELGAIQP